MKKIVLFALSAFVACVTFVCAISAHAQSSKSKNEIKAVTINGKLLTTDIILVKDKAYIPVVDLAKMLGMTVVIDKQSGTILLKGEDSIANDEKFEMVAKDALRALEALQSVVRSGVSYRDYGSRRAEAAIIVDRFLNDYKSHPSAVPMSAAMMHFKSANDLWEIYYSNSYSHSFMPPRDPLVSIITDLYPEIKAKEISKGEHLIYLPEALSIIWNKASESIDTTRGMLKK